VASNTGQLVSPNPVPQERSFGATESKPFSEWLKKTGPNLFAPKIHAALTAAAVFREHSQAFVNLSMHEQRLYRIMTAATKSLDEMKSKRIAARQAGLDAAVALSNLNKMLGVPSEPAAAGATAGFVFKPEEIDTESRRHRSLLEAKVAQECNYDRKKFRQHLAAQ
jgi:hypothetical protein